MKRRFDDYERLHKAGPGGGSLWLAPDHLLVIDTTGAFFFSFRETYRRYDYDRIQGVYWSKSRSPWLMSWLLGVMTMVMALLVAVMAANDLPEGAAVFGALTLLPLALLVWDISRGPRGNCRLQTAVANVRLQPVKRLRHAERLAAAIAERCREAQGETIDPEEAAAAAKAGRLSGPAGLSGPIRPPALEKWMDFGFWGAVATGLLALGELVVEHMAYSGVLITVMLGSLAALMIGAARRGLALGPVIGMPFWICAAVHIVLAGVGYVATIVSSISASGQAVDIYSTMLGLVAGLPGPFTWLAWLIGVCGTVMVIAGVWGALAVVAARRARKRFEVETAAEA